MAHPPLPDHYATLGVRPTASLDEIRAAFKKRAFACHPDRGGSHAQMIAINQAWEVLSDPAKCSEYDTAVRSSHQMPAVRKASPAVGRPERRTLTMFFGKVLGKITRFFIWLIFRWKPGPRPPTKTIFTCTRCKQKLRQPRPDVHLRCPKCGTLFTIISPVK